LLTDLGKPFFAFLQRHNLAKAGFLPVVHLDETGTKQLVPNRQEQDAITQMISWRKQGKSLRQIAMKLTEAGVSTRTGQPWSAKVIASIIKRQSRDFWENPFAGHRE
jgi:hypothetical protein